MNKSVPFLERQVWHQLPDLRGKETLLGLGGKCEQRIWYWSSSSAVESSIEVLQTFENVRRYPSEASERELA